MLRVRERYNKMPLPSLSLVKRCCGMNYNYDFIQRTRFVIKRSNAIDTNHRLL